MSWKIDSFIARIQRMYFRVSYYRIRIDLCPIFVFMTSILYQQMIERHFPINIFPWSFSKFLWHRDSNSKSHLLSLRVGRCNSDSKLSHIVILHIRRNSNPKCVSNYALRIKAKNIFLLYLYWKRGLMFRNIKSKFSPQSQILEEKYIFRLTFRVG